MLNCHCKDKPKRVKNFKFSKQAKADPIPCMLHACYVYFEMLLRGIVFAVSTLQLHVKVGEQLDTLLHRSFIHTVKSSRSTDCTLKMSARF